MTAATSTQTISGTGGAGGATAITMVNDGRAVKIAVNVSMAEAWPRLVAAYESMGIKIAEINEAAHTLGNPGLRVRRRLGDIPFRTALNCGGENSAPNSESYDLTLSFRSVLTSAPGGVEVETYIRGTGVNSLTNSGNYVQCYSQGVIEQRIAEHVKTGAALKKP